MKHWTLRLKLILGTALLLLVSSLALIALSFQQNQQATDLASQRSSQAILALVKSDLTRASQAQALSVTHLLNEGLNSARVSAFALGNSGLNSNYPALARADIHYIAQQLLVANPRFSASYIYFQPNAYDGLDSEFPGQALPYSSPRGSFASYWIRNNNQLEAIGEDQPQSYLDMTGEFNADYEWYLCSKYSKKPCILEPYEYEITPGHSELLTSITYPILRNNEFIGLTGIDINLPVLQQQLLRQKATLFDGQAQLLILSSQNLILASTQFPQGLGQSLATLDPTLNTTLQQQASIIEQPNQLISQALITPGNIDLGWRVVLMLPTDIALKDSLALTNELLAYNQQSTTLLVILGSLIALLGLVAMTLWLNHSTKPMRTMQHLVEQLASSDGDLTKRLSIDTHRELIDIAQGFNAFIGKLQQMVLQLKSQNTRLEEQNKRLSSSLAQSTQASEQQKQETLSVASAMVEMSSTANEVAQLAQSSANDAQESTRLLSDAKTSYQHTLDNFTQVVGNLSQASERVQLLAQSSDNIARITTVIGDIAEQTNLLALNAAIEAARAGDQGRGFAVVADEVRSLAGRTQTSTQEIRQLIQSLQDNVSQAVDKIKDSDQLAESTLSNAQITEEHLSHASHKIDQVINNVTQVATAAEQQHQVSNEISQSMVCIGDASDLLAAQLQQLTAINQQVMEIGQDIEHQLSQLHC